MNTKKIENPLTIIAIFAGIAETVATIVLPQLPLELQKIFIWFVILFPLLLVLLFFVTLNWNNKVLYAPSDFKDENNFMKALGTLTPAEQGNKIKQEIQSISESKESNDIQKEPSAVHIQSDETVYLLAEDLALRELEAKSKKQIYRNFSYTRIKPPIIFDGLIADEKEITAIEVKFIRSLYFQPDSIKKFLEQLEMIASRMRASFSLKLILIIVTDLLEDKFKALEKRCSALIKGTSFPVDLQVVKFADLKRKFGVN